MNQFLESPTLSRHPKDSMDIKVYTDMMESHLLQLLGILHPHAKCVNGIHCECLCRPQPLEISNSRKMWVEWSMYKVVPVQGKASYEWASELHRRLRKFPCLGDLTIKYDKPRANWGETSYYYGTNYSTGFNHTWDNLDANGGLTVRGQAHIPMPDEASDCVVIRLEWKMKT